MFLTVFPSNFLDRLDPSYREELIKLVDKIDAIKIRKKRNQKILEFINDFSSKLLMPKQFWDEMIKIGKGYPGVDKLELAEISVYHLSYLNLSHRRPLLVPFVHDPKLWWNDEREIPRLLLPRHRDRKPLCIENFCYPHKDLEKKWKEYEENSLAFIPKTDKRRYEKMKMLYSKIKSIKRTNVKELFKTIAEAEDVEFVEQNVEYQIGQDLSNKTLWKLYISYLQKNDQKKLLETYSKYCRFFIDDFEMFKEYQKTAEKFGPSKVPWKNTFDFEIYDKSVLCVFKTATLTPSTVSTCSCHFDATDALAQKFPFRPNLMEYIIKNAKAEILFDLFKCCKWFFARYPFPICYKFEASCCEEKIHQQSVFIKDLRRLKIDKKIFVSFGFVFNRAGGNVLSKFILKIYRCTAKDVIIYYQNLSMKELKFLIGHGDVFSLNLFYVKDQDRNQFAFENILQLVPKIQKLDVNNTKCPENLSQYLRDFPFQNKLERFCFGDVKVLPEPYGFAEFMLKNASEIYYSSFVLKQGHKNGNNNFGAFIWEEEEEDSENEEETEISRFKRIVNEIVYQQRSGIQRPSLLIY